MLKKNGYRLITVFLIIMAGATGFEPVPKVLETRVLPLTPCPYMQIQVYHNKVIIANEKINIFKFIIFSAKYVKIRCYL